MDLSGQDASAGDFTIITPRDRRYSSLSELSTLSVSDFDIGVIDALETIIKYRFNKLSGRNAEVNHLREAFDRVSIGPSEVVFLRGLSGSGKTAIVDHALRAYASGKGGYFCYGKFDQGVTHIPFSAMVQAYTDLVDLISSQESRKDVKAELVKTMTEDDIHIMSRLLSNLLGLLGAEYERDAFEDTLDAWNTSVVRLKLFFSGFLRALSSNQHPIVLVLDDLQWSDQASQEVIKALINDSMSNYVLVICIYRSDEFESSHDFKEFKKGKVLNRSELVVDNLVLDEMNEMLARLTQLDPEICLPLSEVVLSKTNGNPFHAMQFLEFLARTRKLTFDGVSDKWSWNLDRIVAETNVSENVVLLVERKIRHLPKASQLILEVAAYLGFNFEFNVLERIMNELRRIDSKGLAEEGFIPIDLKEMQDLNRDSVLGSLEIAVTEGLIEPTKIGEKQFKFRHARIQEAARQLLPAGQAQEALQARLGGFLYKMAKESRDQVQVMHAVDLLNHGSRQLRSSKQRINLARLNLEASEIAVSRAALAMAREYIKSGIRLLEPGTMWSNEDIYPLTLNLHSALAELGESSKDVGRSKDAASSIFDNAHSELEKMRAHHANMETLIASSHFDQVLKMGRHVLSSLGYRFPRKISIVSTAFELIRVKSMLRGKSEDRILGLPVVENQFIAHTMRVLASIGLASYYSGGNQKHAFALSIIHLVRLTCKYGFTESSLFGFSMYGCLLSLLGQHDLGYKYGQFALQKIAPKLASRSMEGRGGTALYHLVFPWRQPLGECIRGFKDSYRLAISTGDTHSAFSAAAGIATLLHHTGTPLWNTEERMQRLVNQMKEYCQDESCRNVLPFYQVILNLRYPCDHPSMLKGDAMDISMELETPGGTDDHSFRMQITAQVPLAYYFEDWDQLKILLECYDGQFKPIQAHFSNFLSSFSAGLAYFELFRLTLLREYHRSARKKVKQVAKWLDGGNVNCLPLATILRAEALALSEAASEDEVLEAYERGAAEAAALGLVQVEATAHERAAVWLKEKHRVSECRDYLSKCVKIYHDWGADAKVMFLTSKYGGQLVKNEPKSRRPSSSSMSSRASNHED